MRTLAAMAPTVSASDLLGLGLSARTAYRYARLLDRFERELEALGLDLLSVGPGAVAELCASFAPSHSLRCQLRGALRHAWDLLGRADPPLKAVRVPKKPLGRCKALTAAEALCLERHAWARGDDPGLAVLLGLYAGLRRAEIAGVAWEHFQFSGGRPVWLRVAGKGGAVADVPVHPQLARALLGRRSVPASLSGWLFPGKYGHVSPATIWAWARIVGAGAGLPDLRTHVLRHTCLAEAHDRSGDLRAVQRFARHAKPETTLVYTRTAPERLTAVVGMIDYGRAS